MMVDRVTRSYYCYCCCLNPLYSCKLCFEIDSLIALQVAALVVVLVVAAAADNVVAAAVVVVDGVVHAVHTRS